MVPIPSQAAILRAAKAVPGGARPTPAPQGSGDVGPYFGRFSPLAAELANERGYANAYSPFLPRPARTFTEGAFGPFSPILPVPVDAPAPGADLPDPRRFDYPVGWNLPSIPGQDGFRLASFATLETLSRLYSVARTCIQRRKMTIGGLEWDIVPTKEAAKAYSNDHAAYRDFGERRSQAVKFFDKPDPNYFNFDSFMSALLEQVFVFDALSLVIRPKRGRGLHKGVLGSDLDCLELIDGQTIRPLLGLHGEMPRPPAPYVQQYIQGVPRSDFQSMWDGRDIEEAGLKGYEGPAFSSDQLLYLPTVPRANSPYGMSAVEMALVVIMTGLQKQAYQLNYYNEGTVPAVYISPGDMTMTPAQIRELQGALNGFASDQAWHHKIIVTPPGSKIDPQRPASLADQFDEIIMASVAMVFDVDPMSLGIIPAVSTAVSPFAAKEMAESSRTVHERTSTKPLLKFLASIANSLLHRVMSQDDMKFTFSGMDEANDQAAQTDMLVKQVQSGLISIDEAREELQRTAWGLDETSGPLVFTQMGPVPLNQVIEMMRQQQPMQGGQTAAANSGNSVTASHQPRAVHHPPSSRPVGTHNPRLGLPAGSGGADLAPSPGGASDTPAHAAARAHQAAGKRKAVMAELEALARQVRKGRHIATWIPEHIPGVIMASLAEDLTKGIGIDEAVRDALALPEDAYEWVEKAGPQQNQNQQRQAQALAQQYAAQVRAVFGQVAAQAARLIAQWLSGALAVTAAALAAMITALLAKLLEPVLRRLWADAWALGRDTAAGILGAEAPSGSDDDAAFQAWADSHGRDWLEQITDTHEDDVAAGLYEAGSAGEDAETVASRIGDWLDAAGRSVLIAVDQVQRAMNAAVVAVARKLGVVQKHWVSRHDAKTCPRCLANDAEGWVNFDATFGTGALQPPQHPRCRCSLSMRLSLNPAQKLAGGRRYVDLPGQEWWPADSYPSGPAMGGGGQMHAAHDADDIQQYVPGGVPGMTAGGEPPRWGGSEAEALVTVSPGTDSAGRGNVPTRGGGTAGGPYRDFSGETHNDAPQDADDAAWPGERAVGPVSGRSWPLQGYGGGYWPQGGHGTAQAPVTSIGATERERPPNAVGKGAADLSDPNPVDSTHVLALMEKNFPRKALKWVKSARWIGPVHVPLDRIDFRDEDSWAAAHEPEAVGRFADAIGHGTGHTHPVILVQSPENPKAVIIDGHHRTLACRQLGWPVKAYVGNVKDVTPEMLETHTRQVHSGSDPANKSAETPIVSTVHHPLGHEGLWHTPDRHVSSVQQLPAYFQNTARALMRDQGMGESEAIATAVNAVDEWRHGTAFGGKQKVTPEVQQAAQRAWDEWTELKESHHQ